MSSTALMLRRQYSPSVNIAGGVRYDLDPLELKPNESSFSQNWIMRLGKLVLRDATRSYTNFSTVTNRTAMFNGAATFEFDQGNRYRVAINFVSGVGRIWKEISGTWAKISTDADMTLGGDLYPWSIAYGVDTAMGTHGTAFFTNGTNEIMYWDETTCGKLSASAGYNGPGGPYAPKYCCVFEGSLILANIYESASQRIYRMRASAVNSFNEFRTTNGAQVVDHGDSPGAITGVRVFGNRLLVLKEDQIIVGQHTQDATTPLVYPLRVNTGCLTGRSFQDLAPGIGIFLGPENVYLFTDGTTKPVGDPVKSDIFNNLDYSKLPLVCSHVQRDKGLYRLFIPSATLGGTLAYVYNFIDNLWFREYWPGGVYATADTSGTNGTLISALVNALSTYTNQISTWGSTLGTTLPVFSSSISSSDYRLMSLGSYAEDELNGYTTITPEWWSKDVELNPDGYSTLLGVYLSYKSASYCDVTVGVSVDRGASWTDSTVSIAPTGSGGAQAVRGPFAFRISGRYHRIRIKAVPTPAYVVAGSTMNTLELSTINLAFVPRRTER